MSLLTCEVTSCSRLVPSVSIGVGANPNRSSVRPTKCVTPWLSAARRSCSSAGIGTTTRPFDAKYAFHALERLGWKAVTVDDDRLTLSARSRRRCPARRADGSAAPGSSRARWRANTSRGCIFTDSTSISVRVPPSSVKSGRCSSQRRFERGDGNAVEDGIRCERLAQRGRHQPHSLSPRHIGPDRSCTRATRNHPATSMPRGVRTGRGQPRRLSPAGRWSSPGLVYGGRLPVPAPLVRATWIVNGGNLTVR